MRRAAKPWGYKLDYDKAIAEDLRCIALIENQLVLAASFTERDLDALSRGFIDIHSYVALDPERAARVMQLELSDIYDYLVFSDYEEPESHELLPGWYQRGEAVWRTLEQRYDNMFSGNSLGRIKRALSKYKASLARHRRNKAKFGG